MFAQAIRIDSTSPATSMAPAKVALLGSGTVGVAVLQRLSTWRGTPLERELKLVFAANTRLSLFDPDGLNPEHCAEALVQAPPCRKRTRPSEVVKALGNDGIRILIDATADAEVAANHPELLDTGIHVATACKLATGTSLSLWREIQAACKRRGRGLVTGPRSEQGYRCFDP